MCLEQCLIPHPVFTKYYYYSQDPPLLTLELFVWVFFYLLIDVTLSWYWSSLGIWWFLILLSSWYSYAHVTVSVYHSFLW